MAISAINFVTERVRQGAAGDDSKFFKQFTMFFELRVPQEMAFFANTTFLFPLIVTPDTYNLSEPFTVEATPTQGAGLYVEENGIVQRVIRISGTTGFKPRKLHSSGTAVLLNSSPDKKSYSRGLPGFAPVIAAISGHRHFMYLQDAVFRTYADLKRDPTTAEDTKLIFHIPKDDEHWLVVPRSFELERMASKATLYRYNIELLVVDKAEAVDADFSEDGGILGAISDTIHDIKKAIDLAQGAINDITAVVAEVKGYVKDVAAIIDGVSGVIDAAANFTQGVSDLIQSPLAVINSIAGVIDSVSNAVDVAEQAREDISKLPETIKQKFVQMGEAIEKIGVHTESFATSSDVALKENAKKGNPGKALSSEARSAAATKPAPTSLTEVRKLGTAMTQGDLKIMDGSSNMPVRPIPKYKSGKRVAIEQGDTLANLAARYLGDARRWQELAIVNGLKPPFLNSQASMSLVQADEVALPGVLGLGGKIVIPTTAKGPRQLPTPTVLAVKPWEPLEIHLLGRDIMIEGITEETRLGKPLYDIPIDVEGGSVDVKLVAGIPNLIQGLMTRLGTEKGSDTLYRRMGVDRILGTKQAPVDLEASRFRLSQALLQDPRLASVRRLSFLGLDSGTVLEEDAPLDALVVDAVVEVRGFTESANVRIVL